MIEITTKISELEKKVKFLDELKEKRLGLLRDISDMEKNKDGRIGFGGTGMPHVSPQTRLIVWNMVFVDLKNRLREIEIEIQKATE